MGERYLIDTNVYLGVLTGYLKESGLAFVLTQLQTAYLYSVINRIELLGYSSLKENEEKEIQTFLKNGVEIGLSDKIVTETIRIRKRYLIKLPDAIIAASAIVSTSVLLSGNIKDFRKIEGLLVINPFDL